MAAPPLKGKNQKILLIFLKIRTPIMKSEEARRDLSKIIVQRKFIRENKLSLKRPLKGKLYGKL
ncbi:chitosanase [Pediococcus pentosaceus]|uniref:chitosanase n=1 Tax=Pediococcus pentosaceus TaxID=1255 RepID=UPI003D77658A